MLTSLNRLTPALGSSNNLPARRRSEKNMTLHEKMKQEAEFDTIRPSRSTSGTRIKNALAIILSVIFAAYIIIVAACRGHRSSSGDVNLKHLQREPTITKTLKALYEPILVPITKDEFIDHNQRSHALHSKPWTGSLGPHLCLVDIETKRKHQQGPGVEWGTASGVSAGMLNHYAYAQIHGYSYKFIPGPWAVKGISGSTNLRRNLETLFRQHCHTAILVDVNLGFTNLELPLEWLLNKWNVSNDTLLTSVSSPDRSELDFPSLTIIRAGVPSYELLQSLSCLYLESHNSLCDDVFIVPAVDVPTCVQEGCNGSFARGGWGRDDLENGILGGGVVKNVATRLYREFRSKAWAT